MLGRFAVPWLLLLFAREFSPTRGYVHQIQKDGKLEACVSDTTTVAFGNQQQIDKADISKLDVVALDGSNLTSLAKYDCNLVVQNGCQFWNLSVDRWNKFQWRREPNILFNAYDLYPMITDFRWNDLPVYYTNGKFKEHIKFHGHFKMHFSMLANGSAQFLFTNDPQLSSGRNAVIDGWDSQHKSVLRFCTYIPATGHNGQNCNDPPNKLIENKNVFNKGEKWAHATVAVYPVEQERSDELHIDKNIQLNFYPSTRYTGQAEGYFSFKTNEGGLFKLHKYDVLRPKQANSYMELNFDDDMTGTLCLDVVFLTAQNRRANTDVITLSIWEGNDIRFRESIKTTGKNEWVVQRITLSHLTIKNGWTLRLKALVKDIVIGGVKFCKQGGLVMMPKTGKATSCRALHEENNKQTQPTGSVFDTLLHALHALGECKAFKGNCAGYALCDQIGNSPHCTCFPGFSGDSCQNQCSGGNYGVNCSKTSIRHCLEGKFNTNDGTCKSGCVLGYVYPNCVTKIKLSIPRSRRIGYDRIILDVAAGLKGIENVSRVLFQYKKKSERGWHNASQGLIGSNQNEVSLSGLNPKTEYSLRCVLFEKDAEKFSQNLVPGGELDFTTTCRPIVNSGFDLFHATIATMSTNLVLLATIGILIFLKKKLKTRSVTQEGAVKFSTLLESESAEDLKRPEKETQETAMSLENNENKKGEGIYDVPMETTEVEKYLRAAFEGNNLMEQFDTLPRGKTQPWDIALKPGNSNKNRCTNLAAYDSTRVILDLLPGIENSDYINANYVDGCEHPRAYIASQGPLKNTVDDFWRMVWQEKISLIVMVTNLVEDGKEQCEKYWPDANKEAKFGRLTVRTVVEEINADYVSRSFLISCDCITKLVQQLQFTSWPIYGVPPYPMSVANFVEKMTQHKDESPILVHCSSGAGRTGTAILIDACLRMVRSKGKIDVMRVFTQMRSQRANLVHNLSQFEFAHLVLFEMILIPKFDIGVSNFEADYKYITSRNNSHLREIFARVSEISQADFGRAEKPASVEEDKCRFPDFISSSSSVVRLSPSETAASLHFVNAVFVDGYKKTRQFIATQVPLTNTVHDFWTMIGQFNVKQIVVLNEPHVTDGQFLPTEEQIVAFDGIRVSLEKVQVVNRIRSLDIKLEAGGEMKSISAKCVSGWMPGAVAPPDLNALVGLWAAMQADGENVAVVCHDGVTASGLFLGVGFVIGKIKAEQKVDPGLALRSLRKARPAFISSEIQFGLLYKAARIYLKTN